MQCLTVEGCFHIHFPEGENVICAQLNCQFKTSTYSHVFVILQLVFMFNHVDYATDTSVMWKCEASTAHTANALFSEVRDLLCPVV